MLETLQQVDQDVFLTLNGISSSFWDHFMWLFTSKLTWVPLYAALLYVIWKNFNLAAFIITVVAVVLIITFADQVCATLIRPAVARMRPSNPNNPISQFVYLVNEKRGGRYGFPSCHAANTFALAFTMMFMLKNIALNAFFFSWATINSYSRIYIGVHYPGDLIAGLIVGLIGAFLIYFIYKKVLLSPKLGKYLKVSEEDRQKIKHRLKAKETRVVVFTGILTTLVFCVYSFVKAD